MTERRVYTPPLEISDYALGPEDGDRRRKLMIGTIMAVVVAALAAFSWNTYGRPSAPPLIAVASRDFKTRVAPPEVTAEANKELYDAIEGAPAAPLTTHAVPATEERLRAPTAAPPPAPAAPQASAASPAVAAPDAPLAPTALSPAPSPGAAGRYVVQLAALRSRDDAEQTWRLFLARAPGLAQGAHMDVQRAELGAQGVYFRLRAGYFETREKAGAFCDRAKTQGHDCMVVVR